MSEPLENWMLKTSILRLSAHAFTHEQVMFIAQGRCLFNGKRQKVQKVRRFHGRRHVWRIADEGVDW
jgi:hypothetical protein